MRWPLAQRIHDEREARCGEEEAGQVEAPGDRLPVLVQEEQTEDERAESDRQINVKDPAPRELVDQEPAKHRPTRRPEDAREDEDARDLYSLARWERAIEHRCPHRGEQATARPLEDAEDH